MYLRDRILEKPAPVEVERDLFSLESLIAWLEKQPAETTYQFSELRGCLAGLYAAAHGFSADDGWIEFQKRHSLLLRAEVFAAGEHTFGAALTRAKRALQERNDATGAPGR